MPGYKKTSTLIREFNEKIERVTKLRPDIAEIQPLKRTKTYGERFERLSRREKTRARKIMEDYLKEGAEERSEKYHSLTKWGAESSEKFVKQANKQKAAYYKSPFLSDIDKAALQPKFEEMTPERAKRAIWALEKKTEADIHMSPELYKQNYLEAVSKEMGTGYLYTYVDQLPADVLIAAYYSDPAVFEIKFIYSQDEKIAQQQFLIEQFESFVSEHSNFNFVNPFEVNEDEEFTII